MWPPEPIGLLWAVKPEGWWFNCRFLHWPVSPSSMCSCLITVFLRGSVKFKWCPVTALLQPVVHNNKPNLPLRWNQINCGCWGGPVRVQQHVRICGGGDFYWQHITNLNFCTNSKSECCDALSCSFYPLLWACGRKSKEDISLGLTLDDVKMT